MTTEQMQEYLDMRHMMRQVCHPREGFSKSVGQALLRELTPRQQESVYLYYVRQMTMGQVAQLQGVNISTVSRSLARARKRLRRVLAYLPRLRGEPEPVDLAALMTERL